MSQQRATSSSDGGINNTEPNTPNTNNAIIVLDDSDDEEKDVQFVSVARPIMPVIDLCMSPSTSAAAAAAAAAAATTTSNTGTGDSLKTANSETTDGGALAPAPDATSDSQSAALECAICLQTCIHPARLPCGHIFCFLCVKVLAYKNRRCAMCRREIPAEFLDHPQLVNGIDDIYATRATEDGYQWYYEGRNGGWWAYDERTNDDIETAFKAFEAYKTTNPKWMTSTTQSRNSRFSMNDDDYCFDFEYEDDFDDVECYTQSSTDSSSDCEAVTTDPSKLTQLICGQIYIIDLAQMSQALSSQPIKKRNIVRLKSSDPKPVVKGVAGLRAK
ncbi:uncharacterized protein LOC133841762 isoform X4 [Drosophila sulfurigaster albostrigata]|uniref:uncharacterized protein LOC133841762 isoform X4 n=1 Tax=Drosophila sulfurigaster albostrigata TaxID=89887 RepID=UPI002D21C8D9|nr:uncharacterized protein LOC133841762 isoform X4 [Drosophila sulfurigaster albostrigata]